jgi:hypothetical protein
MPTSDYHQISDVLDVVAQAKPNSVLDIGVGFGKWGILCREILEIYEERVNLSTWVTRIDGIEIHEPYRNPLWDLAYNEIFLGNAPDLLKVRDRYDMILCCDVIEHFHKNEGQRLIELMLDRADYVVITSPCGYAPQGAVYGNEHETHLSGWDKSDFSNIPHLYKKIGFTFVVVLSNEPSKLEKIKLSNALETLGVKKGFKELSKLLLRRLNFRVGNEN